MKKFLFPKFLIFCASLDLLCAGSVLAQLPSGDAASGMSAAMLKLFGSATAFIARADTQVFDASQKEIMRLPMNFSVLDGKLRVETDLSQMRGKDITTATISGFKQLGLDRVTSILRPDKELKFIVFPGAQSYVAMPLPREESAVAVQNFKMQKTPGASETVDGHACVKNQVVVSSGTNSVLTATVWNAGDLKDFPVRILTREKNLTTIMQFRDIQFTRADAKLFEAPGGYKKFSDPQALLISRSTKVKNGEPR